MPASSKHPPDGLKQQHPNHVSRQRSSATPGPSITPPSPPHGADVEHDSLPPPQASRKIYPQELTKSPSRQYAQLSRAFLKTGSPPQYANQYAGKWAHSPPSALAPMPPSHGNRLATSPPSSYLYGYEYDPGTAIASSPPPDPLKQRRLSSSPPSAYGHVQPFPHNLSVRSRRSSIDPQANLLLGGRHPPPLPHQSQPHFFGLPDPGFGLPTRLSNRPSGGESACFYGLDTLQASGNSFSLLDTVLVCGYEGGLDVYKVNSKELDLVGNLQGLDGRVVEAAILQSTTRQDPLSASRPLIAVVIHGSQKKEAHLNQSDKTDIGSGEGAGVSLAATHESADSLQTTVEVYSLKSHERIATLLETRREPVMASTRANSYDTALSTADFRLNAKGRFLTITSSRSGEIYIFTESGNPSSKAPKFKCIGKTWTTMTDPSSRYSNRDRHDNPDVSEPSSPLFSLSQRWLATVPPGTPFLHTVNAIVLPGSPGSTAPGLTSITAPEPPRVDCTTDTPDGDGLVSKLARSAAQEMIKGAQWAGNQGIQAWRNYWRPQDPAEGFYEHSPDDAPFPPTHAASLTVPAGQRQPSVIAVLDLNKLLAEENQKSRHLPAPLATFTAPQGCSFLSFSPSGLSLLTISASGDTQFVWDLMRITMKSTSMHDYVRHDGRSNGKTPRGVVRQLAKFSRMTSATVVDVVWAEPRGHKIAVLTSKGTVHVSELPSNIFQWPPPSRPMSQSQVSQSQGAKPGAVDPVRQPSSPSQGPTSFMATALQTINGKAEPLISAVRSRGTDGGPSTSLLSNFVLSSNTGIRSGKAVAAGVSKSIGAAAGSVSHLRRASGGGSRETRLRLDISDIDKIQHRSMRFLVGIDRGSIATLTGSSLDIHRLPRSSTTANPSRPSSRREVIGFALPTVIPTSRLPEQNPANTTSTTADLATSPPPAFHSKRTQEQPILTGFWTQQAPAFSNPQINTSTHPLSFAELETSPPFRPFHTDHRVTLSIFESTAPPSDDDVGGTTRAKSKRGPVLGNVSSGTPNTEASSDNAWAFGTNMKSDSVWAFGTDIRTTTISVPQRREIPDVDGEEGTGFMFEDEGFEVWGTDSKLSLGQ